MKEFRTFNALQTIAAFGVIFSVIVQLILLLINKNVPHTWALYPTWAAVFVIGSLVKKYVKYDDDHEHHHHH